MDDETNSTVRDNREPGWYWIENELVRRDGKVLGVAAIAVYNVLASYANNNTQKAFPGIRRIAELLGISPTTAREAINRLRANKWIEVHERVSENGAVHLSHEYVLLAAPATATVLLPKRKGGVLPKVEQGATATVTDLYSAYNKTREENIKTKEEARPPIFLIYEHEIGPLTASIADGLKDAVEGYTEVWVSDALKLAAERGKRSWAYAQGILRGWKTSGKDWPRKDSGNGELDGSRFLSGKYADEINH